MKTLRNTIERAACIGLLVQTVVMLNGPGTVAQAANCSDSFDDGIIDSSLWEVGGARRGYTGYGAGSWQWSHTEITAADGYLRLRVYGPASGNSYAGEAWVRTKCNYNDGSSHVINFRWGTSINASHIDAFAIEITDGYVDITTSDFTWFFLDSAGNKNLWLIGSDLSPLSTCGNPTGAGNLGPLSWSIRIDAASKTATLFNGPNLTGTVLCQQNLDPTKAWFVRFIAVDATSAGFPAGDNSLFLYDYSATQGSGGLVAYYPFDGNANDASGNGNNASFTGATPTTDRFGNPNSAFAFDDSSHIDVPSSASLKIGGSAISMAAWVYPTQFSGSGNRRTILRKMPQTGSVGGYLFDLSIDGYLRWGSRLASQDYQECTARFAPLTLNFWSHVAVTYDGSNTRFYVNGDLVDTIPWSVALGTADDPLCIGRLSPTYDSSHFYGKMDDVRIYNRALSAAEICQLAGCTPPITNCIYTQDFSSDPGWTTDDPTKLRWDSASGTFHATIVNAENRHAYTNIAGFNPNLSWRLEFDLKVNSCDWSAGADFGIFDSAFIYTNAVFASPNVSDGGHGFTLHRPNGLPDIGTQTPQWTTGVWYRERLDYNAASKQLTLRVSDRSSGTPLWQLSGPVSSFPADMTRIAVHRPGVVGNPGVSPSATVDYNLDNVSLCQTASGTALEGRIAYARYDNNTLWVFDTVTQQPQQVPLPGTVHAWSARWTSDGEWIVFTGGQGGNTQMYAVRPDGTGLRRITDGTGNYGDPAVCRIDGRIAYEQAYGDVFCINFDGTGLTDLGYGIGMVDWSPDCNKLVGSDYVVGGGYNSDLWVWNLTTSAKTKITSRPADTAYGRAAWSPDGSKIAAVFSQNGQTDIVLMNPDGSGIVNLTADWASSEDSQAWSPDGQYLLFTSTHDGSADIWVMRPDGSGRTKLISGGGATLFSPTMTSLGTNTPPTLVCPQTITAECGMPVAITNQVADADGDALTLVWSVNGMPVQTNAVPAVTSVNPTDVSLVMQLPLGTNIVVATVTDGKSDPVTCSTTVTVADTLPPTINWATATPSVLWPPNHQMVTVQVKAEATDLCGTAAWRVIGVTCNETAAIRGAGRRTRDWVVLNNSEVSLRAERSGAGVGRVYTIALQAVDEAGNQSALKTVTVTVPHDMRLRR